MAHEKGVTWYDVAPPYGDGQAEDLLGRFLQGRRDDVVVCTKLGIDRPQVSTAKRLARSIARPIVKALPQIRSGLAQARRPTVRAAITAKSVEDSVVRSLRDLKTSHVDVLALHDPTAAEVGDPELIDALTRMVTRGYARALSIAGNIHEIGTSALPDPFTFVQAADNPFCRGLDAFDLKPGDVSVTHSALGSGSLQRFSELLSDRTKRNDAAEYPEFVRHLSASALLLRYAFCRNPNGVVLTSMFSRSHVEDNVETAALEPDERYGTFVEAVARGSGVS